MDYKIEKWDQELAKLRGNKIGSVNLEKRFDMNESENYE